MRDALPCSALGVYRPTEEELFFEALEGLLDVLGFSMDEDYDLSALTYRLKSEVDGMYPLLEYDFATAFAAVRTFAQNYVGKKKKTLKKLEDDR